MEQKGLLEAFSSEIRHTASNFGKIVKKSTILNSCGKLETMTENHEFTGLPPKALLTLPNQPKVIGRTEIGGSGQPIVFWPDFPEIEKEITLPCTEGILSVAGIPDRLHVVNVRFCCQGRTDHLIMEPTNRPMVEPERP